MSLQRFERRTEDPTKYVLRRRDEGSRGVSVSCKELFDKPVKVVVNILHTGDLDHYDAVDYWDDEEKRDQTFEREKEKMKTDLIQSVDNTTNGVAMAIRYFVRDDKNRFQFEPSDIGFTLKVARRAFKNDFEAKQAVVDQIKYWFDPSVQQRKPMTFSWVCKLMNAIKEKYAEIKNDPNKHKVTAEECEDLEEKMRTIDAFLEDFQSWLDLKIDPLGIQLEYFAGENDTHKQLPNNYTFASRNNLK